MYTLPGVSDSNAPRAQFAGSFTFATTGFSIGGSSGRTNLITIDGGENDFGSGQNRTRNLSIETVQEFQVNRNAFAAEFGFTSGSAVNVVTRGGTNRYRSSIYTFYRSQKTSARNAFNFGPTKAFEQRIYPGFTFGGPVVKNKAFFFLNYETLKFDASRFRSYTGSPSLLTPTATSTDAALRAQTAYLTALETAAGATEATRAVAGRLRTALTGTNYPNTMRLLRNNEGAFTASSRIHNATARMDFQLSNTASLNFRLSISRESLDNLGESNAQAPDSRSLSDYRDYTAVVNYNQVLSSTLVNQFRVQMVPNNFNETQGITRQTTSLGIQGFASFGRTSTNPFISFQDRYQFEDVLAWNRNNHIFKFGASYRPYSLRLINEIAFGGLWTFSGGVFPVTSALAAADRTTITQAVTAGLVLPATPTLNGIQAFNIGLPAQWLQGFNNAEVRGRGNYFGSFAQDSWKISRRFSLDAGVRFDYFGEPNPPLNKNGYVSPRLGFALDVTGDQKTVVRGGGGLFYSPINIQNWTSPSLQSDSGLFINQVLRTATSANVTAQAMWACGAQAGKLPFASLSESDVRACGVTPTRGAQGRRVLEVNPDYANPYSIQGSLSVQRQLVRNLSLEVSYLVYRALRLPLPVEMNYRESGTVTINGPQYVAIDPTIAQRVQFTSSGNSIYHGMTTSLTKRFSHHFQMQANYTFSKALDNATDFNGAFMAFLPTRLFLERALSTFNIRHNFVVNAVVRSPFKAGAGRNVFSRALADITLAPVVFARTGVPFTLRMGADVNGNTHITFDRPWPIGRNTGIGPNFVAANLRLSKQFYLKRDRSARVEFIAEATNLFNHTNFLAVNDVIAADANLLARVRAGDVRLRGDATLARTLPLGFTAVTNPRQIQFGLRIGF